MVHGQTCRIMAWQLPIERASPIHYLGTHWTVMWVCVLRPFSELSHAKQKLKRWEKNGLTIKPWQLPMSTDWIIHANHMLHFSKLGNNSGISIVNLFLVHCQIKCIHVLGNYCCQLLFIKDVDIETIIPLKQTKYKWSSVSSIAIIWNSEGKFFNNVFFKFLRWRQWIIKRYGVNYFKSDRMLIYVI